MPSETPYFDVEAPIKAKGAAPSEFGAQGIQADVIAEDTAAAGVTVDGVLLKDGEVTTDTINEETAGAGVTVDGVLLKDGQVAGSAIPTPTFATATIAGGSAGDHTVTGIASGDTLVAVLYAAGAGTDVTDLQGITSEFSVTGADTINNGGGTDTTGGKLVVIYMDNTP